MRKAYRSDSDVKVLFGIERMRVGEGRVADLVDGVGSVGD